MTSPIWPSHLRSLPESTLWCQNFTAIRMNAANITSPMKGWRMRAHVPPPSRFVSQNIEGWKNASPEAASRKKVMAVTQCRMRSPDV